MYTVLIPAFNEEKTVRKVLKIAASAPGVGQVLLIDDGSTDKTLEKARGASPLLRIISHNKNMGKGAAVRTGIASADYECVVFIDADLVNITGEKIAALAQPILENRADFVKASFTRARGRVTELAVKPMMQILFPDTYFEQPISGQFAARLTFLKGIKIVEDWGLDIGILLDAISKKLRIEEVFIGELEHKAQSEDSLAKMSEQVLYTMIQKAGLLSNKYKLVIFSFDESILKNYSLERMMAFLGKREEFQTLQDENPKSSSSLGYYTKLAMLLEGVEAERLKAYVATLELRTYAHDIIEHLRRRRYQVAIVGMHFSPVVNEIARRLGVAFVDSLGLKVHDKKYTGEMTRASLQAWFKGTTQEGYWAALNRTATSVKTEIQSTIVVAASVEALPMIEAAGLGVAYRIKDKRMRKAAEKSISILPELLLIVE